MAAVSRPDRTPWRQRPRWHRWAAYVAAGSTLLLVAVAVLSVAAVRRSFPQTGGTIEVPGLEGEVTVVRDGHGVPQVYADTAADLFFAQGFVQAQDRFFEMDVRRHVTAGRLSEMVGEEALETDKVVRTMGWRRVAEVEVRRLEADAATYLEAFSAGVNAYISDRSPGEMSLEYTLLSLGGRDQTVEPWTPVDSVSWLKAMAWDLRSNVQDEVDRAMASARLTAQEIAELYPAYPYDRHQPAVDGGSPVGAAFVGDTGANARPAVGEAADALAEAGRAMEALPTLVGTGDGIGSNAWAVSGEHTTTGQPLLANDPHLAPTLPGVWYQMGLHCTTVGDHCPFDVSGFTFAGVPGVIIGHNQQIAWGLANLGADVSYLYLEAVEGERYLRGSRWREFERR